jgi:hypothetical protein
MEIERGSTIWHPVENSLWKRRWTCRETDNRMMVICTLITVFRKLEFGQETGVTIFAS